MPKARKAGRRDAGWPEARAGSEKNTLNHGDLGGIAFTSAEIKNGRCADARLRPAGRVAFAVRHDGWRGAVEAGFVSVEAGETGRPIEITIR